MLGACRDVLFSARTSSWPLQVALYYCSSTMPSMWLHCGMVYFLFFFFVHARPVGICKSHCAILTTPFLYGYTFVRSNSFTERGWRRIPPAKRSLVMCTRVVCGLTSQLRVMSTDQYAVHPVRVPISIPRVRYHVCVHKTTTHGGAYYHFASHVILIP